MNLEPRLNLISSIILFGVLQSILLSVLFLRKDSKSTTAYLGWILIILGIIETESFLNYSDFMIYVPHLINISPPLIFLIGPLAFFYVRKSLGFRTNYKHLAVHLIPAILYFIYTFFFFLQPAGYKHYVFLVSHHPELTVSRVAKAFPVDPFHIQGYVVVEGLALHLLAYVVLSLRLIFSQHTVKVNAKVQSWLRFFCFHLLGGTIIFLLTGGTVNGYVLFKNILPPFMVDFYCTFLVYSISTYWLGRVIGSERTEKKYARSEIPVELRKKKLEEITRIIEIEKPFTEPGFSLDWLAKRASISTHHLSQVINTEMGMSFIEFINVCRIREAQKILKAPEHQNMKVEMLAYQLGYQSKSAFFNAFRRYTDTTPAQFRIKN